MDLFKAWLHFLDNSLSNKSLLLIDSCGAHGNSRRGNSKRGNSSDNDPLARETWRHLQIERLPPNSTSVTQPLEQGIFSVFKRQYLEMLSNKAITKEYATGEKITNGEAWSLIPYAWSHIKAATVRHCFCKAGVLSKAQSDKLEQESIHVEEQTPLYPPVTDTDASEVKGHYVRLIASVMDGDRIRFSLDRDQKDTQDIAEEIKQKVRNKITKRYGLRERSSSVEPEAIESFKSRHESDLATMVVELLGDENASYRKTARYLIRKSSQ
ncbi:hypothetical protein EDD11_009693 [Mortierella claussenii]|nr:hypothetical protein EDD11_009693 [Mortierella claussenii]